MHRALHLLDGAGGLLLLNTRIIPCVDRTGSIRVATGIVITRVEDTGSGMIGRVDTGMISRVDTGMISRVDTGIVITRVDDTGIVITRVDYTGMIRIPCGQLIARGSVGRRGCVRSPSRRSRCGTMNLLPFDHFCSQTV